ncbi:TPA: hypothetical protein N0F65_002807 [Lagenidium giganteum]|uniref:PiggyBac transposable element-derived protein domain-containing protein n=1 Tax=Lagenidium giganteum TaxID=4803 RepID=A0AAV2ZBI9_9STRA|nr:TPA: hypothetical protein N0F65_002807 [Lagenidium giganteum]
MAHEKPEDDANVPMSQIAFRNVLKKLCPTIRIRSSRSIVCDVCVIHNLRMTHAMAEEQVEDMVKPYASAKAKRERASDSVFVTTMDFAQNVALPHLADTPSMWYFISLIAVYIFGVYTENTTTQHNFIYSESAGKGSNEVVSMLNRYARETGIYDDTRANQAEWCIYTDNI